MKQNVSFSFVRVLSLPLSLSSLLYIPAGLVRELYFALHIMYNVMYLRLLFSNPSMNAVKIYFGESSRSDI